MRAAGFTFLFVVLITIFSFGQSPRQIIDSLLIRVQEPLSPDQLANMYGELGWQYASINLDSAIYFGKLAVEKAELAGDPKILAQAFSDLGSGILQKGDLDESKILYLKSLRLREEIQDSLGMAKSYNALGFIHQRKYESDSAIKYFLLALPIFQKSDAQLSAATVLNNLGVIYQNLSNYEKAKEAYEESTAIREELGDFRGAIASYNNLGTVYKYLGDFEKAESFFQKAIAKAVELGDLMNQAVSYRIYGAFLMEKGDLDDLEEIARKGLQVAKEVNSQYDVAALEHALGVALNAQGKFMDAKGYLLSAASSFQAQGSDEDAMFPYFELISVYAAIGMPDSSRHYGNLYQQSLRSKLEKESKELVTELQTKYETEKKDREIAEQQLAIRNKNLQLYGSLILALALGILGYLLYRQQKLKNQQLKQEAELKAVLAQLETQNKLQEQRLLISRDLHDNIGAQLTFIISAIENLKFFEPVKEQLNQRYDSIASFTKQTITELRDTIWAMNSGQVTWESLAGRVQDYLQKARQSSPGIQFEFSIADSIQKDSTLGSAESIQVLRIIQEAVQNAVKYAEASSIKVEVNQENGEYQVSIQDNGKGFEESEITPGNGLYNMRKRAEELGGVLEISSNPGNGTVILLIWDGE
ncbi:tetratricopeptide repeat-containing sensor histidine kinase [Algoriphagus mannitolivorans]|uniref:tetratricopeptide repeat-containing sensor histidine kinase n=1 Tax=Algoriphagus mannitolivorans TaxID=226504 RepID=UPI00040EAD09|nr:sensor histidine kinase [Algoriphagus mannitolivorans]